MNSINHAHPQIDPRGGQFAAGITSVVLAAVLLLLGNYWLALGLLLWQTGCFAIGAIKGPQFTPYSWLYRKFVQPKLPKPTELEDVKPPQFAQAVGLTFSGIALIGLLTQHLVIAQVALVFALVAALLNAVFGICLGCEMYLLVRRMQLKTEK